MTRTNLNSLGDSVAVVETRGYRRPSALVGSERCGWVAAFWGVLLRGAVAIALDAGASMDFVRRTVAQSGAKLVLRGAEEISGTANPG